MATAARTIYFMLTLGFVHEGTCVGVLSAKNRLFRDLMVNYNRNILPKLDPNEKMIIDTSFVLKKLETLEEKEQWMTSFGWIAMSWHDDLLSWDPSDYNNTYRLTVSNDEIWIPELSMYNSVDQGNDLSLDSKFRATIYSNGYVAWIPGFKWTTACSIDLQYFPFDTQTCSVQFVNWMYGEELLDYAVGEMQSRNYEENDAWTLVNRSAGHTQFFGDDEGNVRVPMVYFNLTLARKPTYYLMNVVVPSLIISSMSLLVFLLPSEAGEKMSLAITVFLAYTVLLLMISDITPKSGKTMPLLTLIIVMNMAQTGMSLLLTVVILRVFHSSGRRPVPGWVRRVVLDCFATILCMCSSRDVRRRKVAPNGEKHSSEICTINQLNLLDLEDDDAIPMGEKENDVIKLSHSLTTGRDASVGVKKRDVISLPDDVIALARHLADKGHDAEAEDKNRREWQAVSRVLDRLFFFSYVVMTGFEIAGYVMAIMFKLDAADIYSQED